MKASIMKIKKSSELQSSELFLFVDFSRENYVLVLAVTTLVSLIRAAFPVRLRK